MAVTKWRFLTNPLLRRRGRSDNFTCRCILVGLPAIITLRPRNRQIYHTAKTSYGKYTIQQKHQMVNIPYGKISYSKYTIRHKHHLANIPYGKNIIRQIYHTTKYSTSYTKYTIQQLYQIYHTASFNILTGFINPSHVIFSP